MASDASRASSAPIAPGVLPTGYACALTSPPRGAIAVALQALTLLVNHRLAVDAERYRD